MMVSRDNEDFVLRELTISNMIGSSHIWVSWGMGGKIFLDIIKIHEGVATSYC